VFGLVTGRNAFYSELKGQAGARAPESGVNVQSADGFIVEQYSRVRQLFVDISAVCGGLAAGYQPRPQVVDRGTTARYGGQLRYMYVNKQS